MRTNVYMMEAIGFNQAVAMLNVLRARHAKLISVSDDSGFVVLSTKVKYRIWFEHECALEPEWRASIWEKTNELLTVGEKLVSGETKEWCNAGPSTRTTP